MPRESDRPTSKAGRLPRLALDRLQLLTDPTYDPSGVSVVEESRRDGGPAKPTK
jgi:hypothetical protein